MTSFYETFGFERGLLKLEIIVTKLLVLIESNGNQIKSPFFEAFAQAHA
jgi:hypothetical protein